MRHEEKLDELWRITEKPHEYIPFPVPVSVENPKTKEFEIVRTSVLPGLLTMIIVLLIIITIRIIRLLYYYYILIM